ncbi:MAG TPA: D-2-hydroxyacid dehydrogenase [Candidatus Limnocylindria bacterium]|nr:D-2-hydroxyacid dehydrogenase [Candidatus Limnocylindria bacterium]
MSAPAPIRRQSGPGGGPGGVPAAIALSPILSARYREQHLERVAAAAPGSRLVSVSLEGLADSDLSDVEVLLRGPLPMGIFDRLLARCPRLMWVHSATAGVERVLTPTALERGLAITNARGVFSDPIAEYVMMMVLAVSRRLPQLLELQRERTWQPLEATEMRELTVGVVGLGSIGRRVAELALGFGCRVVATRRSAAAEPDLDERIETLPAEGLPQLVAESDFIVLALPLTADTEDTFDAELLAQAKPGAWLINVARGALVDERALVRALREGPLGGAVLDAFRQEPLPADSTLYDVPNLIITPHTAWSSRRVLDRSIALFCDNLERFRRGEPLENLVDPTAGY